MGVAIILLAGGSGTRLGDGGNKVYADVAGRPLVAYPLETLERSPHVDHVVIVARPGDDDPAGAVAELVGATKVTGIVSGGPTRHLSEHAGIAAARDLVGVELIGVHDAARPFATLDMVEEVVRTAARVGGAIPAIPVDEPVFDVSRRQRHVDPLVRAQTPQVFRAAGLLEAFDRAARVPGWAGVDTAETVERHARLDIAVVPGDPRNLKVTYGRDLALCRELAADWVAGAWR